MTSRAEFASRPPRTLLALGLLIFFAPSFLHAAECPPPDSLKARFQTKPTASDFTDLGVWFADQQQYACAADAFATSVQMEPTQKDAPRIIFMFGSSLYLSGDAKEAIPALVEAARRGYRPIKLHLILAEALDSTHDTADAEAEWRAALQMDSETTSALDALSNDLVLDGDFKGIIALLDTPRLHPQRTPQQCFNLGLAYAKSGDLDQAVTVLRDGLNTAPDSVPVANELAAVLAQLGRPDEAVSVLQIALSSHPDDARTHESLGALLAQMQQFAGAKDHLERAIALGDDRPEAKQTLAKVLASLSAKQ